MNRKGLRAYQAKLLRERKKTKVQELPNYQEFLAPLIMNRLLQKFIKENADEINKIK